MIQMHESAMPAALAAIHTDLAGLLGLPVEPPAQLGGGLAPWQANRVKAYIAANLGDAITVDDLAALAGLSASYFSRAFRATFGETPYAHVLRQRIDRACHLMLAGDEPLSQIAVACGLADQSHFTRLFRRFRGTTPHAWRRFRQLNTG